MKTETIKLRVTPEEKAQFEARAMQSGVALAEWVRGNCREAVEPPAHFPREQSHSGMTDLRKLGFAIGRVILESEANAQEAVDQAREAYAKIVTAAGPLLPPFNPYPLGSGMTDDERLLLWHVGRACCYLGDRAGLNIFAEEIRQLLARMPAP